MGQMDLSDFLGDLIAKQPSSRTQRANKQPKQEKRAVSRVTAETRRESHASTDKAKMKRYVLDAVRSNGELTAREVAICLYESGYIPYPARAVVQPRLTELVQAGWLTVSGKKLDCETDRKVAVYKAVLCV